MKRILIVEDDPSIRKALSIGLTSKDYKVDTASDGTGGLLLGSISEYDVVIIDLCLPDLNGIEVLRQIKRFYPDIIPIVMTGNGSIESTIEAIHLEISDYLEKPINLKQVENAILYGIKKRNAKYKVMRKSLKRMLDLYKNRKLELLNSDTNTVSGRILTESLPEIVHQINSPLWVISGTAQLAMDTIANHDEIKEHLLSILTATEKISVINKKIMKLGRKTKEMIETVYINTILDECILMFKTLFKLNNIRVETFLSKPEPSISTNKFKIEQILNNLILNAIDAMDTSPRKRLVVRTIVDTDNDALAVHICDTGCGMSKEIIDKILTPYFTTKSHGTGLGLPVVEQMANSLDGKLSIESTLGKGSTFTISFPLQGGKYFI